AVVRELEAAQAAVGRPPPGEELAANDPRRLVAEALSYLGNNTGRMNYPEYRRLGLPTTGRFVESLGGACKARAQGEGGGWGRRRAAWSGISRPGRGVRTAADRPPDSGAGGFAASDNRKPVHGLASDQFQRLTRGGPGFGAVSPASAPRPSPINVSC